MITASTTHFGHYSFRSLRGMFVVYDSTGDAPTVARFSDGNPAIFACAVDALLWVANRISRRIGE